MDTKILKIFLATPGDLEQERKTTREVVERINKAVCRILGLHIELLGWEDTLPGCSRPQSLINNEVDSCDLFIGILWQRWGQPTGEYRSGFEEEFIRARERHNKTDKPEIWLFFKNVDEDRLNDPGEQLKKVIEFKNGLIEKNELFFKEFPDSNNWGNMIRDHLDSYILEFNKKEFELKEKEQSKVLEELKEKQLIVETTNIGISSSYSPQIISLFQQINRKLQKNEKIELELMDSTRLFLQSNAWFSEKHTGEIFGNHEINLSYIYRLSWQISDTEKKFLFRSFISDLNDLRPGWYWLRELGEEDINNTLIELFLNDSNTLVRRGAINLLAETNFKAERDFIEKALSDEDDNVIEQAIRLVRNSEKKEYIDLLDSISSDKSITLQGNAKTVKIELLYLSDPNEAFNTLINSGIYIPPLLNQAFNDLSLMVDDKLLLEALHCANTPVRRFCAKYLNKKELLSKEICYSLLKDPDDIVRKEALTRLIELDERFEIDSVMKLFPIPAKSIGDWLGSYDLIKSEVNYEELILLILKKRNPEELLSLIDFYSEYGHYYYKVLSIYHFETISSRIHSDLNDEFESLQSESLSRLKEQLQATAQSELLSRLKEQWQATAQLESLSKFKEQWQATADTIIEDWKKQHKTNEYLKSCFISAALEGLAKNGTKEDVKYARKFLGKTKYNLADVAAIQLLSKFGDLSDVDRLLENASKTYGKTKKSAIIAAFKLSTDKDAFLIEMINKNDKEIADIAISFLNDDELKNKIEIARELLVSKIDDYRLKGLAILFKHYKLPDLEKLLNEYLSKGSYYYNVVTWIDRCLFAVGRYKEYYQNKLLSFLPNDELKY